MNNLEFYTPQENWPQPADAPATLLPAEPPEAVKKKKKKTRMRKKMSESLSGLTAAALAVVMLTTALTEGKPGFGGLDVSPGGAVCSICHDPACPYLVDAYPGLRLSGDVIGRDEGSYASYDLYKMTGPTAIGEEYCTEEIGITTRNLERLIFRLDSAVYDKYFGYENGLVTWQRVYGMDKLEDIKQTDDRNGMVFYSFDQKSGEYTGFLLAFLVYAPDGLPGYDVNAPINALRFTHMEERSAELAANAAFRTVSVPGFPDAQIQLYTDLGQEILDAAADYCIVDVVPALTDQQLGETMVLRESEDLFRSYIDNGGYGLTYHCGYLDPANTQEYRMEYDFSAQEYATRSVDFEGEMTIRVLPDVKGQDWSVLAERADRLNREAEKTGHKTYFEMEQLDLLTVNGITYDCWMAYTPEKNEATGETRYRPEYMFVPVQEPTVMLSYDIEILSDEELAAVRQDSAEYFNEQMPYLIDRLSQISLR